MSEELKPCPFCGGDAELITSGPSNANHSEGAVHSAVACFCFNCQVMPYPKLWHVNDYEAIKAWNTRTLTPDDKTTAIHAISFALETEEGLTFLRLWNEGEFGVIRDEWPDCPDEVFDGAEPLFKARGEQ